MTRSARRLPEVREMIATLVAEPSPSSADPRFDQGNRRVVEHLAGFCESLGMRVELLPSAARADKVNLLATFGEGDDGLILAGHADTVPWDEGGWRHDPFRVTEEDGKLYGLGTSDMKSFFAVALTALARLDVSRLRAPIVLLATYDEESTMGGARALVAAGRPKARHAIIGEPTNLVPVRLHKGAIMETVTLLGRTGHSSDPGAGKSALEGMHAVISDLITFREALQRAHRHEAFAVPVPTMNFGAIHGGDSPNRICGECELRFDLRALPGMDVAGLRAELRARVTTIAEARGLEARFPGQHPGTPPFETAPTAEIVRAACELTGHEASSVAFGTEGPYLTELGAETIICGPGDIARAHQPDESIDLASLPPAVDLIERLVRRFCLPA
jgi:acetylornithine deacetylase